MNGPLNANEWYSPFAAGIDVRGGHVPHEIRVDHATEPGRVELRGLDTGEHRTPTDRDERGEERGRGVAPQRLDVLETRGARALLVPSAHVGEMDVAEDDAAVAGVEVTRLGKRTYRDQLVERLDPYGNPYYWVGGPAVAGEAQDGTDVAAMAAGKISVTPITLDLTNHALLEELARWDWGWSAPVALSAD